MSDFETVILSAYGTPIGAFGGVFKDVSAMDLGAVVIREAIVELKRRSRRRRWQSGVSSVSMAVEAL
jgi:acetyl-CoA acetyltransferase